MNKVCCVYILASRSRQLYTGVTGNLERRILEHRNGLVPGFTARYKIFRLVHFETCSDIRGAIAREKEIKGWRREKKIKLIERNNPAWEDLASHMPDAYPGQTQSRSLTCTPKAGVQIRDDNKPVSIADTQRSNNHKPAE